MTCIAVLVWKHDNKVRSMLATNTVEELYCDWCCSCLHPVGRHAIVLCSAQKAVLNNGRGNT